MEGAEAAEDRQQTSTPMKGLRDMLVVWRARRAVRNGERNGKREQGGGGR